MAIALPDSTKAKDKSYFHETKGKISDCASLKCRGKCCEFDRPDYNIVVHPNEIQAAHESGFSTDHLMIVNEDFHGGKLAVCVAKHKSNCDNSVKPFDCFAYPFFPLPDKASGTINLLADPHCKLILNGCDLSGHIAKVKAVVTFLIKRDPSLVEFWTKARPKDYVPYVHCKKPRASAQQGLALVL